MENQDNKNQQTNWNKIGNEFRTNFKIRLDKDKKFPWGILKYILAVLAIIAIVIFISTKIEGCKHKHKVEKEAKKLDNYLKENNTKQWKDENGNNHATNDAIEVSHEAAEKIMKGKLDSLAKMYNVKVKNLENVISFQAKTIDKIKADIENRHIDSNGDTVGEFKYGDGYMDMNGKIINCKKIEINYSLTDTFDLTGYRKRDKILGLGIGKSNFKADVMPHNKKTSADNLKFITIKDLKEDNFIVGPGFGGFYDLQDKKIRPVFSINITYRLFGFRIGK